jgi:hypothetical protein
MAWRDKLALASRRQADYAWVVLARVLSRAFDRGLIGANPCEKGGRLYRGSRADKVWTADDEAAFLKSAPAHLHLPLLLDCSRFGRASGKATCCACRGRHTTARIPDSSRAARSRRSVRVNRPEMGLRVANSRRDLTNVHS